MPIKDRVIAYDFLNEFLDLMKTGKDNNDETFRKKSEWLKKEDTKFYNYIMIAFLDAKKNGKTPKTPEELLIYTKEMLETYVSMSPTEIIEAYNGTLQKLFDKNKP
ncbi:MAG: hypothetical protein WA139_03900 [Candidatus Aenigmatarchaeota archaeon]